MSAVETFRSHNMWHNRMVGEESDLAELSAHVVRTQAIAEGRTWARSRGCDHIIRDAHGAIESTTSYAPTPTP